MKIAYDSKQEVVALTLTNEEQLIVRPDLQKVNNEVIRIEKVTDLKIDISISEK